MKANLGQPERIVRGIAGVSVLAVGFSVGHRTWWGVLVDVVGALLVFSALTGFCHVRKVLGDLRGVSKN